VGYRELVIKFSIHTSHLALHTSVFNGGNFMNKKTVKDIDVENRKVLVRCHFNVPLDKETGVITDNRRIRAALPTIQYLLDNNAKVILCSHLGRPKGEFNPKYSLKPVAEELAKLLQKQVKLAKDVIGEHAKELVANIKEGEIVLLENVRFHAEEEKNESEGHEEDDGQVNELEFEDGSSITMGALITEIKKVYTKAKHEEMAILSVEDLVGTCDVMMFPKTWARVKNLVDKESVVKISGKISVRDGQSPIIIADSIELMSRQNSAMEIPTSPQQKLYLRFNLQDPIVKADCFNALTSYSGDIPVVIKDTATGNAFAPDIKIRECKAILYELNQILGEENVKLQ